MALISVTRPRLRSMRYLSLFAPHTLASMRQAQRAPGFLGEHLAFEKGRSPRTVAAHRMPALAGGVAR
jgi:hypothetical protein